MGKVVENWSYQDQVELSQSILTCEYGWIVEITIGHIFHSYIGEQPVKLDVQCTMCLSPLKGVNQRFDPDLYHCPHFEAVSLFQTKYLEIASCAVLLLNDIWVQFEHNLLKQLDFQKKSVKSVCRQDANKIEHQHQKSASNIWKQERIKANIFIFQTHFYH